MIVAEINIAPATSTATRDSALIATSLSRHAPIGWAAIVSVHARATTVAAFTPIDAVPDGIVAIRTRLRTVGWAGTACFPFGNAILTKSIDTAIGQLVGAQRTALTSLRIARFAIAAILIGLALEGETAHPIGANIRQQAAFAVRANARNRRTASGGCIRRAAQLFAITGAGATGIVTTLGMRRGSGMPVGGKASTAIGSASIRRRGRADTLPIDRYLIARAFGGSRRGGRASRGFGIVLERDRTDRRRPANPEQSLEERATTSALRKRLRE